MATVFLKPDKTRKETIGDTSITIKEKIIPDNAVASKNVAVWCQKGQKMKPCAKLNGGTGKPRGITVHNTPDIKVSKDTTAAEQYTRATYPNCNMSGVVVHFYVKDEDIWQNLREDERGWHATDGQKRKASHRSGQTIGGNLDTIAIECIGNSPKSEDTTAKLVAYLCKKYGLDPMIDVYQHNYFYPTKPCPEYIRPHWDEFLEKCNTYYKSMTSTTKKPATTTPVKKEESKPTTVTPAKKEPKPIYMVRIIYKTGLNVRTGPGVIHKKVMTVPKDDAYTIVEVSKNGKWGLLKSGYEKRDRWICITSTYVKIIKKY